MADGGKVIVKIDGDNSGFKSAMGGLGKFGKTALKGIAVGAAAVGTATVGIGTSAIKAYADYEQLVGGVETLFKDSSGIIMNYANQAYQTAGLSANQYMETVTSFSASLLQSLGGDTAKAAEYGNRAVIDMSDNANKMGTSIEMIQNAYQGFAKQNYTMLDNLKLGYGGTKTEMERLLADAEKISGIHYDISSFADITEAIHVMQVEMGIAGYSVDELDQKLKNASLSQEEVAKVAEDMGISYDEAFEKMQSGALTVQDANVLLGTTAKEAATTIQGSLSTTKAAWENLMTGLTDPSQDFDTLMQNFLDSVATFAENLIPRIQEVLPQIATMIGTLAPLLVQAIADLIPELLPTIVDGVIQIGEAIINAIPEILPALIDAGQQMASGIFEGLSEASPLLKVLAGVIAALVAAWGAYNVITTVVTTAQAILNAVMAANPIMLIIIAIAALVAGLIVLWNTNEDFRNAIKAIWEAIKDFFIGAWDAIKSVWNTVADFFSGVWESIKSVFSAVGSWFGNIFSSAWEAIKNIWGNVKTFFSGIWDKIKSAFNISDMLSIGKNIVQGIIKGVSKAKDQLTKKMKELAKGALDTVKSFLGIKSPSRVFRDKVGAMIDKGIAVGIDDNKTEVEKALNSMNETMLESEAFYLSEKQRLEKASAANDSEAQNEYLSKLKETADRERKIFEARQKDAENAKQAIKDTFKELAEAAFDEIDEIEKAEKSFSDKLKDFGDLHTLETIKWLDGEEYEYFKLADIESQTNQLKEYADKLQKVKERGNVPQDFFATLRDLSVEEGEKFADALLKADDKAFNKYIDDWKNKQAIADEISKTLYADEVHQAKDEIEKSFNEFDSDLKQTGKQNAEAWGESFFNEIKATMPKVLNEIHNALASVSNTPSFAFAGGGAVNNYGGATTTNIYHLATSSDSISEQIRTTENAQRVAAQRSV